ncbi:helix-turn-helix transcriptional regulator [Cupriavidus basilensis]|uniref:Helix-turn-helix transcriptional regulator n=1 Tax=Cupriavidus basilensis TaxID=68895 RepID=A0ABT6AQS2_9BURK|nr:helix-turn-helix transcriptional regulator [Cupriavidus basilensis]MDF3834961.1 helix-turn-helix transcriptional regulator [Cupriavidus basilensis]
MPRTTYQPVPLTQPTAEQPVIVHLRLPPPNAIIRRHRHTWGQISFPLRGSMRVTAAGTTWVVPTMRAVWIPPEVEHEVVTLGETALHACYVLPAASPLPLTTCSVLEVSALMRHLMVALADSVPLSPRHRQLSAALLLEELRAAPTLWPGLALPTDRRLKALCDALMEEPGSALSLAQWAERTGASERTLARLFRTELRTSFAAWRQQLRLAHAVDLINRGRPLAHVAAETGYANAGAFSTMFRRALGKAPRDFMAHRADE